MAELVYKDESYAIIGAAQHVHNVLGEGFLEDVYQEALAIELQRRGIPFEREARLNIVYDGMPLKKYYVADFVCCSKIILELKAVNSLQNEHRAQTINYLKATGFDLALLINFGEPRLKFERFLNPSLKTTKTQNY